jgi:hypothetical protein
MVEQGAAPDTGALLHRQRRRACDAMGDQRLDRSGENARTGGRALILANAAGSCASPLHKCDVLAVSVDCQLRAFDKPVASLFAGDGPCRISRR